ncbi:MAG: epimerase [Aliishimia sp.]
MTQNALILGASGRFGRHAAAAFETAGWTVSCFDRTRDDLEEACKGQDVIVNGWNPPDYTTWARDLLPMHQKVIDAARATDATVIIPGNVYVFGADTPHPWTATTRHQATNPLGDLRRQMEEKYRASGVRTIILRGGDFLDTETSGSWFDLIMVKKLAKGVFTYPGAPNVPHAWAYLPDIGRAAQRLADIRSDLPVFCDVPFPGYTLTANDMRAALSHVTGREVTLKQMSWMPLQILKMVMPSFRGLCEMRYLWNKAHSLERTKFSELVPDFEATPLQMALTAAVAHTR